MLTEFMPIKQTFAVSFEKEANSSIDVDCFSFIGVFFHDHSRITGLQGKGEDISLAAHFHPLH